MRMTWYSVRYTSTMSSQPESLLMDSLFLYPHLSHPCLLQDTSQGVYRGPGHQFLLNQLPLPQSQPSSRRATTPPPSRPTTRSSANQNSASRSEPRSPATPGRTNDNSRLGQPMRRSARLNPTACTIKSHPQHASDQSCATPKMARTYPLSL